MAKSKVVSVGGIVARISVQPTRTGPVNVVSWYEGGKRQRKSFADPKEAKEFARITAERLSGIGGASLTLTTAETLSYSQSMRRVAELGGSLDTAIWEWSEAKKLLGGGDLIAAVKLAASHNPSDFQPVAIPDAVARFIATKRESGRSDVHIKDLEGRLKAFADAFQTPLHAVRHDAVQLWAASLKVANRTKNNYLAAVQSLVAYAELHEIVPKGLIGVEKLTRYTKSTADVAIFTPDDMRKILSTAREDLIPFLAISGFAGIRHAEVARMTWNQIHFEGDAHFPHGWIELKAKQSKNVAKLGRRARRLIPMSANLKAWLKPRAKEPDEKICRFKKIDNQLTKLAAELAKEGVSWKANGLRHSYGSYRLAQTNDEGKVALEMGNSPAMIFANYRRVVSPKQADEWFAILPIRSEQ